MIRVIIQHLFLLKRFNFIIFHSVHSSHILCTVEEVCSIFQLKSLQHWWLLAGKEANYVTCHLLCACDNMLFQHLQLTRTVTLVAMMGAFNSVKCWTLRGRKSEKLGR